MEDGLQHLRCGRLRDDEQHISCAQLRSEAMLFVDVLGTAYAALEMATSIVMDASSMWCSSYRVVMRYNACTLNGTAVRRTARRMGSILTCG